MFKLINERHKENYIMQLLIAQNPHVKDPNLLFNQLRNEQSTTATINDKMDKEGIKNLKRALGKSKTKLKIK